MLRDVVIVDQKLIHTWLLKLLLFEVHSSKEAHKLFISISEGHHFFYTIHFFKPFLDVIYHWMIFVFWSFMDSMWGRVISKRLLLNISKL